MTTEEAKWERKCKLLKEQVDKFLIDKATHDDLMFLKDKIGQVNIFSVLKVDGTEIRHSNVLAWLFDTKRNHGLGSQFVNLFFGKVLEKLDLVATVTPDEKAVISELIAHNFSDVVVKREENDIDILLVCHELKKVIVIENKTGSNEIIGTDKKVGQLEKYYNIVNEEYLIHGYKAVFLFLDSEQNQPTFDKYYAIDYSFVKETLVQVIKTATLSGKVKLILEDYYTTIKEILMKEIDEEVKKKIDDIYSNYQEVIDYIHEQKANKKTKCLNIIEEYLKEQNDLGFETEFYRRTTVVTNFTIKDMRIVSNKKEMLLLQVAYDQSATKPYLRISFTTENNGDNTKSALILECLKKMAWKKYTKDTENIFSIAIGHKDNPDVEIEEEKKELLKNVKTRLTLEATKKAIEEIKLIIAG